jgi:hypothetical protein
MSEDSVQKETWFVKYWRPAAAWIYLSICVFDFVIMPVYHLRSQGNLDQVWEKSLQLRPEDQLQAVVQLTRRTSWQPITMAEGGFFHLSMGAILGVAAWTRGRVQQARVETGARYSGEDDPIPGAYNRGPAGGHFDSSRGHRPLDPDPMPPARPPRR